MKVLKSFIFSFLLAISAFALDLSNVHTWIIPDGEVERLEIDGDEVWHRPARTIFYFSNSQPVITNIIGSIGTKYRANTNLVNVEIGELATGIGNYAFDNCKGLTNIVIPDNIKTVGASVFYGNTSLTNIVFGSGVTNIGTTVFSACTNLQNVTILGQIPAINNWIFQNCSALTNITFPDSVQSIGNQSFYNCKSLTNFDLPPHLKNIGTQAFTHCDSLTSISIPDSIETIGTYTFYYCYGLTNISLPNNLTNLPNGMLAFCTNLLSITLPQSLVSIGHYTLQSCQNIQSVVLPDSVESIGNNSFENEKKLSTFTFGLNINSVGTNAFRSCSALNTFYYYKKDTETNEEAEARIKNLVSGSGYNITGKDFVCLNYDYALAASSYIDLRDSDTLFVDTDCTTNANIGDSVAIVKDKITDYQWTVSGMVRTEDGLRPINIVSNDYADAWQLYQNTSGPKIKPADTDWANMEMAFAIMTCNDTCTGRGSGVVRLMECAQSTYITRLYYSDNNRLYSRLLSSTAIKVPSNTNVPLRNRLQNKPTLYVCQIKVVDGVATEIISINGKKFTISGNIDPDYVSGRYFLPGIKSNAAYAGMPVDYQEVLFWDHIPEDIDYIEKVLMKKYNVEPLVIE